MLGNPTTGRLHRARNAAVTKAYHRRLSGLGSGLNATPASILPPQDRLQQSFSMGRPVGVTDQPETASGLLNVGNARTQIQVLPAHVRDVMDTPTRRSGVPVDESHRPQADAEIAIDGVLVLPRLVDT